MISLITAIFSAAEASLQLLSKKEEDFTAKKAIKLNEKLHDLRTRFYEEYNKNENVRSDAILDHIQLELRIFLTDFASFIRSQNVQDK